MKFFLTIVKIKIQSEYKDKLISFVELFKKYIGDIKFYSITKVDNIHTLRIYLKTDNYSDYYNTNIFDDRNRALLILYRALYNIIGDRIFKITKHHPTIFMISNILGLKCELIYKQESAYIHNNYFMMVICDKSKIKSFKVTDNEFNNF